MLVDQALDVPQRSQHVRIDRQNRTVIPGEHSAHTRRLPQSGGASDHEEATSLASPAPHLPHELFDLLHLPLPVPKLPQLLRAVQDVESLGLAHLEGLGGTGGRLLVIVVDGSLRGAGGRRGRVVEFVVDRCPALAGAAAFGGFSD